MKKKQAATNGTLPGEMRATFIVKIEDLEKIKAIAFYERKKVKDVIGIAIEKLMSEYEPEKLQILLQFHEQSKK